MAEYLDKTGLAYLWSKIKGILDTKADKTTASGLKVENVIVDTKTEGSIQLTANVTGNNKFVCWIGVASIGFLGTPYISDFDKPTTHIFDRNMESGYKYQAYYLVHEA